MSKISCPNGHILSSDKQLFSAYKVNDIYDFKNTLNDKVDCWYCDECQTVTVFRKSDQIIKRYDYKKYDYVPKDSIDNYLGLDDYVVIDDETQMSNNFDYKFYYKVSLDRKKIYAFDGNGNLVFRFYRLKYREFEGIKLIYESQ